VPRDMSQVPKRRPPASPHSVLASDLSDHQSPPPLAAAAAATASGSSATFVPPNLSNLKDCPLPEGWDIGMDYDGKPYFIDHKNKTTSWVDPRDSLTKPADFTECVGDELPVGWEQAYDYHRGGIYYVDHRNQRTQETDPRSEWRALQEEMLRSYLASAKNDLKAKQELIDVKHQRLSLAQDEYHNLNNTLSNLSASSTSLNSTCSTGSKYDVDLLRADVGQCKARVQKLKRELVNMDAEVCIKQKGMETLARVKDKYSEENNGLTLEEARAIKAELNNIQKSLTVGEQEKIDLMKNLACLKDDLTRLQHSDSTLDVSKQSQMMERLSTASQTDLSGELMPVGQRLAEMARIRLQYDETRQQVQDIQQSLASLEEKIDPGQLDSDKDRLLLIQEKEQLLRELRSISPRSRTREEMTEVKANCERLEHDLNQALETSNRCIADRLRVHETKQMLLQQLTEAMRAMTQLEQQLKTLSASTLSMSSSSSLGSLSSSHASSKGSLSSLSFTDIYGLSTTATASANSAADLQKKFLQQPRGGAGALLEPKTTENSRIHRSENNLELSSSQQSLSPHSSLSSLSPPVTPMEAGYPPSYSRAGQPLRLSTIDESSNPSNTVGLELEYLLSCKNSLGGNNASNCSQDSGAPLSPCTSGSGGLGEAGEANSSASSYHRAMSSAVSSESVAGDSGVFEAASPTKHLQGGDAEKLTSLMAAMSFEAAQVQIKMRYDREDSLLHIGLEKARNLRTLVLKPNRQLYLKVSLVPSVSPSNWSFTTKAIIADSGESPVVISDNFPVAVPKAKLSTKTLQVTIWTIDGAPETCVGSAQISLADFDWEAAHIRWYNVLGLQFSMLPSKAKISSAAAAAAAVARASPSNSGLNICSAVSSHQGTLKEESSDDSTIISSQASTLTRNMNPEAMGLYVFEDDDLTSDDIVIPSEPCSLKAFDMDTFLKNSKTDRETNTDCGFFVQPSGTPRGSNGLGLGTRPRVKEVVKRSKTFSPKDAQDKLNVKLNRSDSDGAMPLYRKLPFQHKMMERRSLRLPSKFQTSSVRPNGTLPGGAKGESGEDRELSECSLATKLQIKRSRRLARTKEHMMETPLDLELDLAAQKTKLDLLQSDIGRLKAIQTKLVDAKAQGDQQETWLQDHAYLESLLSKIDQLQSKSKEERQLEKMIKKTGREIHKLRKAKLGPGELDKHMFQEKMAFLTTSMCQVPPLLLNEDTLLTANSNSSRSSTLKHDAAATLATPVDSFSCSGIRGTTSGLDLTSGMCDDLETEDSSSSSTCSTPTPHLKPTLLLCNGSPSSEFGFFEQKDDQKTTTAASGNKIENSNSASAASTASLERFSYEIDPDIGVIV